MKNLCIIPARGGSKRIPKKNIKDFLGKPIIAYSIETTIKSNLFDEVMVSTDNEEIAEVAKKYGARVPFLRSEKNANDYATLADVVDEVKKKYVENNQKFDYIALVLPTAPFITVEFLKESLKMLQENCEIDSVRPIVRFSYPIQRAFKKDEIGRVKMMYPEFRTTRSQDLEEAFHDAGLFYFMKWEKALRGEKKYGFVISEQSCQDIDTLEDWKIAELKKGLIDIL